MAGPLPIESLCLFEDLGLRYLPVTWGNQPENSGELRAVTGGKVEST